MLRKLRILIYENWFAFVFSILITFLFFKNIYLASFLYFLVLTYFLGSLPQSLFFSFVFLPLIFIFNQQISLPLISTLILFLLIFGSFKKTKFLPWLIVILITLFLFYFNFLEKINLPLTIFLFVLITFYFSLVFLRLDVFTALISALILLEASFLLQFLPASFFVRIFIILLFLLLLLKFDIIKKLQ
ncbi:MAG: hypothetical protein KatS3mg096_352 [Candidatus Parcubacteria bacterium]|nr:MAG: hypothetical protein KatS3mg096_352 [Candidatus Parcubacteria bacterium]